MNCPSFPMLLLALLGELTLAPGPASAQCPSLTLQVDNDLPGSGYSEEQAQNWLSNTTGACQQTYRYLSHTVGDGSRKGKAIWKPKITVDGWYEVTTSYRGTVNRTDDADYVLYDDAGGTKTVVVNQQHSGDCTKKLLGSIYCKPGGSCRLVLDGTDDSQSDSADITSFKLIKCGGAPSTNPCAKIAANSKWQVCAWTTSTCSGVFDDGAGCAKYCAAAGMVCVARFGGTAPCTKEPGNTIPCGAQNAHQSDWCDCAFPDAGAPPPDLALPGTDAKPGADGPGQPRADGPAGPSDAPVSLLDGPAAPGADGGGPAALPRTNITTGCGCGVTEGGQAWPTLALLALLTWLRRHPRRPGS